MTSTATDVGALRPERVAPAGCVICNVCARPGSLNDAAEVVSVPGSVRKLAAERYTLWRCRGCGSLHSKEHVDVDEIYRDYPLKRQKLDLWMRAAYRNRLRRLEREGITKSDAILDYGCGAGLFVGYLRSRGYEQAVGFDPYVSAFADRTLLGRQYDAVVCQDVIEHDDDPRALLATVARLVRPGGLLCLGTPNADNIDLGRHEELTPCLHQPHHRHILSQRALLEMSEELGQRPVRLYERWYYDTIFPTINHRFLQNYIGRSGKLMDVVVEPPRVGMVLGSASLLFYALFGYLFPPRTELMALFRREPRVTARTPAPRRRWSESAGP